MNFDLGWFTTVPGMFITGGVVLLIIALIILIVTGKKSKKEKKEKEAANANASMNANTAPDVNNGPVAVNQQQPMADVVNTQPVVNDTAVQQSSTNDNSMPLPTDSTISPVTPVVNDFGGQGGMNDQAMQNVGVPSAMPEVMPMPTEAAAPVEVMQQPVGFDQMMPQAPVMPEPVQPAMVDTPAMTEVNPAPVEVMQQPVDMMQQPVGFDQMMPQAPVMPEPVQPAMVDANTQPVDMMPQASVTPVAPEVTQPVVDNFTQPVQSEAHVIYGGASPVVPDLNVNQEPHQIYGGADPLANTQTIPTITSSTVAPTEPVNEIPVIQPVAPVAPEIQPVSDVNTQQVAQPGMGYMNQQVTPVAPVAPVDVTPQVGPIQQ